MVHLASVHAPSLLPTILGLALVACGGGGDDAATLSATAATSTVVAGGTIAVDVVIEGFELADPELSSVPVEGQGHYHVYLDDAAGLDWIWNGTTPRADVVIPLDTTPGAHVLRVQLAGNDHVVLEDVPPVTIPITVEAAALATVSVTSDVTTVVDGGTVTLTIAVENFTLSPGGVGGANVAGSGHYHVAIVGTELYEVGATPTIPFVVDVAAPGEHVIDVSLRNNDHGPLVPATSDTVTITVTAP